MKRLWSILIVVLFSLIMVATGCTAKGVSQEGYDELKHQLTVVEAQLSDIREELQAQLSQIQEDLEAKLSEIQAELEAQRSLVDEEPAGDQKLVGLGSYAPSFEMEGAHCNLNCSFVLTNPSYISDITIEHVCVFAYDGTVVYEGPLLHWREETPWTEPMKPHETRESQLSQYVSDFEWPSESEEWMIFTVEIFWTGSGDLPLTGWVSTSIIKRDAATNALIDIENAGVTEMMNMEQELQSED